ARNLAARVDTVRDQHDRLSSHVPPQPVVGGQVNGIVENRPRLVLHGGYRSRVQAAHRYAQAQLIESLLQQARRISRVLEQLGFGAELDQERLVLLAQNL